MTLIDQILNLACVLLWLNWRAQQFDPLVKAAPSTLVGTLRRAERKRFKGWPFLASLIGLLLFRALIYWQIGPAAGWTPKSNLMFVVLAFRSDNFLLCFVYSLLGFGRALLILYVWLLALAVINRGRADPGPVHKLLQQQLGLVAKWPWWVQILLPFLFTTIIWVIIHPVLVQMNVTPRPQNLAHLLEQGVLVGIGIVFSIKYLIPPLLLAHLLAMYVYLGRNPIWEFVGGTSRNLLSPLSWLPLRVGRIDLAPMVGVVLAVLLLHILPELSLRGMLERNVTTWPP